MGNDTTDEDVDTYSRVFGFEDFTLIYGSIMPTSIDLYPEGTILAFAKGSME